MPQDERAPSARHLRVLADGELEVEGRLPYSSNRTYLVSCTRGECTLRAVYKPHAGERQLWDFPDGLFRREVAAFQLSEALGWGLVPETLIRDEGPLGRGSLQRFVDADFSEHYYSLLEDETHHQRLRMIAVFDLLANNADRKSGHCLLGVDGRIWAIDNGLCFHPEPKLRTVIWEFGGDPIDDGLLDDVARLATDVPEALAGLLAPQETAALVRRSSAVARAGRLPELGPERRLYPWPLV